MTKYLEGRVIAPRATELLSCETCLCSIYPGEIYACLPDTEYGDLSEEHLTEHLDCSLASIYITESLTGSDEVTEQVTELLRDPRARPILLEHFPGVAARVGITANN